MKVTLPRHHILTGGGGASASVRHIPFLSEGVPGALDQGAWPEQPSWGYPSLSLSPPLKGGKTDGLCRVYVPGRVNLLWKRQAPRSRGTVGVNRILREKPVRLSQRWGWLPRPAGNGQGLMRAASGPRTQSVLWPGDQPSTLAPGSAGTRHVGASHPQLDDFLLSVGGGGAVPLMEDTSYPSQTLETLLLSPPGWRPPAPSRQTPTKHE